jgi:tetratricopeptide (TPR) repeat protein
MGELEKERDALRGIARLVEQRRYDDANRAIATLGDDESVARRALLALVHAHLHGRSHADFAGWRRKVAESDAYLNGFYGTELPALVDDEDFARTFESNEALVAVLERVIARLETEGERILVPPTLREQAVQVLLALPSLGAEGALRSFGDLEARHPRSVQIRCYRGELLLWLGRYRQAWRSFSEASRIEPTRWAEIGKLAVLGLAGHLTRAAAQSKLTERAFSPLSGSTLPVYQGVFERRAGQLQAAIEHLEAALEEKPTRLGARIELCLALRAYNRGSLAVDHAAIVLRDAMRLLVDVADGQGIDWCSERPLLVSTDVLEQALRAMRGNRSSRLVTWFDRKGALQVQQPGKNRA